MKRRLLSVSRMFFTVFAVLAMFAACSSAQDADAKKTLREMPFISVPIWFHVHTDVKGDGGSIPPAKTVEYLKSKGYKGVVFTPHSNHGMDFTAYKNIVNGLNGPDFIAVPGREVALASGLGEDGVVMCHINTISGIENPPVPDRNYKDLDDVVAQLKSEKAIYVWNHPWACEQWEPGVKNFMGIELFNDVQSNDNFENTKRIFLNAVKSGTKLFVISGIDIHSMIQTSMGEVTTYVFPEKFERESFLSALVAGHTVAAFNSKLFYLNEKPSLNPVALPDGQVKIEATVGIKPGSGAKPSLVVYKNGVEFTPAAPAVFERGPKGEKGYAAYDLSFTDKLAPGASACYMFEIPHFMFSSPFCYTAGK